VHLFSKLFDYVLIPAHCSTAFGKAGIYLYDPRAIKNDRLVKTTSSTITTIKHKMIVIQLLHVQLMMLN
jgi:hypothetical protein